MLELDNMVTGPLSVRVAGTDDGTGNLDIQAARESRPHGTMDGETGYRNQGWGDDWGRSAPSSSSAPPPDPVNPPEPAPATGDTSTAADSVVTKIPPRAPIISEEYAKVNGMHAALSPHLCRWHC